MSSGFRLRAVPLDGMPGAGAIVSGGEPENVVVFVDG